MNVRKIFLGLNILLLNLVCFANEAYWTNVLAGSITANPISWNKHMYLIGEDKALNCLDIDGSFIWRQSTDGVGTFISNSASGLIFISTDSGKLQAFSSQGVRLWTFDLNEKPLFAPYSSLDGRLFVLTSKNLFCFNQHGVLKWKRKLNASPIFNITETGKGEILLVLKNGDFLRYSIFGHLNEEKRLIKKVSALSKAPEGYLMACSDGSLFYYKSIAGSQSVWQVKTSSPCVALAYASSHYLAVCADGSVYFSTLKDNEKLWSSPVQANFAIGELSIRFIKNEIQLCGNGFAASILSNGDIRWQRSIPENAHRSIICENGMLVGVNSKIVKAYRMEVKFLREEAHAEILDDSYDIIGNTRTEIPPIFDSAGSSKFFNEIYQKLDDVSFSEDEAFYAARLIGILENKWSLKYGQTFSDSERAEAARLLGLFGSYEYREFLIKQGYKTNKRTITLGIIKGLGNIAYDPDGKTLQYIEYVILQSRYGDAELMKAICDCLAELAKYGDNTIISKSISMLFSVINGKFTNNIKSYARQKIKNIVQ